MMEFTWKKTVDDAYLFEQETRKQYEQHIKLKKLHYTWKKELPQIEGYTKGIHDKQMEKFEGIFTLSENGDHKIYADSRLERYKTENTDNLDAFVKEQLDLEYAETIYNIQTPGNFVGPHIDHGNFPHGAGFISRCPFDFKEHQLVRFTIFLTNWEIGQVFMFDDQAITGWKKFSVVQWPWYIQHATANLSAKDRHTLSVNGVKK
jgi:hypothetical protein